MAHRKFILIIFKTKIFLCGALLSMDRDFVWDHCIIFLHQLCSTQRFRTLFSWHIFEDVKQIIEWICIQGHPIWHYIVENIRTHSRFKRLIHYFFWIMVIKDEHRIESAVFTAFCFWKHKVNKLFKENQTNVS